MNAVKVISASIIDGIRNIKLRRLGKDDVQEVLQVAPYGSDSSPIEGMVAIYSPTLQRGEAVIIGYVNKNSIADAGEHRIFSTDSSGAVKMFLHLKNDGTAEFGGSAKNMVRFQEMETAFNQLKSDLNSLITAYNSHTHITTATVGASAVPGIIAPTVATGTPSSADISGAKIEDILTL